MFGHRNFLQKGWIDHGWALDTVVVFGSEADDGGVVEGRQEDRSDFKGLAQGDAVVEEVVVG